MLTNAKSKESYHVHHPYSLEEVHSTASCGSDKVKRGENQ